MVLPTGLTGFLGRVFPVRSLRVRVLLWVSVALVVIFAATIVGLDLAFQRTTERAVRETYFHRMPL